MGTIRLLNITLFGHHGVSGAERETGTRLEIDLELEADLERAAATDDLGRAIDYMSIHRTLESVVREDRHRLLESLAHAIGGRLVEEFDVQRVTVRIRKGNLPLSGGRVEVELTRERV